MMSSSESEAQLRQHIFLFAIGIFLLTYLIGLYRFRSFEWAMLTSSIAFGITIMTGALLASTIRLRDEPAAEGSEVPGAPVASQNESGAAMADYGLGGQAAD